jgi:glycosyltransferase involved in cell wall biosynthesis
MTDRHKSISIIIPTYNDAVFLQKCLFSIAAQSVLPFEVIVVDDGSRDNSAKQICYQKEFSSLSIKFYKIKNSGPSKARNHGFKKSNGAYILFLDADDLLPKEAIKIYSKELNTLSLDYFGVCGRMKNFGRTFNESTNFIAEADIKPALIGRKDQLQGQISCYLLRADYLRKVSCFDERLTHNEDFDLILRLFQSHKVRTIQNFVLLKRFHKSSLSNKSSRKSFLGTKLFLELARKKSLLPEEEILSRLKDNHLSLGKLLFIRFFFLESAKNFISAFSYEKPKKLIEIGAYLFSKLYIFLYSIIDPKK